MNDLSHLDSSGQVRMVDISDKLLTTRTAIAEGKIFMLANTISSIKNDELPKGNVLTAAKIAGIQAAKKTAELIPLCHPLNLLFVDIEFAMQSDSILIRSTVKTKEATGVEMEALTAVAVSALTIYDMCKAVDNTMEIGPIKLIEKKGGKTEYATHYRPNVGIITISDSVAAGKNEDKSGPILIHGFENAGCTVQHHCILPDGSAEIVKTINDWIDEGVKLILTTGGTGLGPRDLTIKTVEPILDSKLHGVEQALHDYGRGKLKTAMLSRLTAGVVRGAIVICLPGNPNAMKDALNVLIPTIFHAFHIMQGEKH